MPTFPIVDAHVHLWDPSRFRMHWLDGDPLLERAFTIEDFREHSDGVDLTAYVYVQVDVDPAYSLLEAWWAAARADEDQRLGAIVAYAPLEDGDRCRYYLEALCAVDPRVVGVRRLVAGESEPGFSLRPDFVRGVRALAEFNLSCDMCIRADQLPDQVELASRCPDTRFVLDHLGKAPIAARALDPWREQISALAALPNVCCKLSGMVTEADRRNWKVEDLQPFASHVLESFGEDRVLFGGDWPVVLSSSSYIRWVEAAEQLTAALSEEGRRKVFAENARRFYRI